LGNRGNGVDILANVKAAERDVVLGQWTGDVYESEEANMLLNLSQFATGKDQEHMLKMALRREPKNEMVLIRLAELAKNDPEGQKVYKERILRQNPNLENSLEVVMQASEGKFGVEVATNYFGDPAIDNLITQFYVDYNAANPGNTLTPGADLVDSASGALQIPYSAVNLNLLRQLQINLTRAVNAQHASPNFPTYLDKLKTLTDPGNPRFGQAPPPSAELSRAIVQMAEIRRQTPDGFWEDAQDIMNQLESDDSTPTGLGGLEGNYQISNGLRDDIRVAKANNRFDAKLLAELESELRVRTAAHDVVVIARLEGEAGANKMATLANRMTSNDFARVEALPGVNKVKELYEQQENYVLALNGGLTTSDFVEITRRVRDAFDAYVAAGIIQFKYNQATNPENYRLEKERALSVGKNLFIYKSRDAHFLSLGNPDVMGGLGIGNTRLDFLVRLFSPGYWSIFRYGLNNPHVAPIVEYLGKDKIDRMLYLQDHDSSIWRIPAYLKEFDKLGGATDIDGNPTNKLALFMRLYWLGETSHNPDQGPGDPGVGGEADFLMHHSVKELVQERRKLVSDIISFVPEELASIFREHREIEHLIRNPNYQQFLTDIALARERCVDAGDYVYAGFNRFLRSSPTSYAIYRQLTGFLEPYTDRLADPDWEYEKGEERGEKGRLNPLFRKRIYSLADAPYEKIDVTATGAVNTVLTNAFGGQDIGRELQNIGAASQAFGVISEYFTHPSMEEIKKFRGKILAYKGWGQDIIVRDQLFDGLVHYVKEDAALRAVLPGLDVVIGKLKGGRSWAQREQGEWADAYDTLDLVQLIKEAVSHGDISHHEANRLTEMARNLGPLLGALQWFPQLQLLVFIVFVAFIKTSLNPKDLAGG
jgi:hypothetical protein